MLLARAIAVQGIGFGAGLTAVQGFLPAVIDVSFWQPETGGGADAVDGLLRVRGRLGSRFLEDNEPEDLFVRTWPVEPTIEKVAIEPSVEAAPTAQPVTVIPTRRVEPKQVQPVSATLIEPHSDDPNRVLNLILAADSDGGHETAPARLIELIVLVDTVSE